MVTVYEDRHPEMVALWERHNRGETVTPEDYEKAAKAESEYLFHSINATLAWSSLPLMVRES